MEANFIYEKKKNTPQDLKMLKNEGDVQAVKSLQGERHSEHKLKKFMRRKNFVAVFIWPFEECQKKCSIFFS
jgi:hypothetical protein